LTTSDLTNLDHHQATKSEHVPFGIEVRDNLECVNDRLMTVGVRLALSASSLTFGPKDVSLFRTISTLGRRNSRSLSGTESTP